MENVECVVTLIDEKKLYGFFFNCSVQFQQLFFLYYYYSYLLFLYLFSL